MRKSCVSLKFNPIWDGVENTYKWQWGVVQNHPLLNTENHCEKPFFLFSDRSYRNRKSQEIWG